MEANGPILVRDAIPVLFQHLFNFEKFNHMQSIVLGQALHSDKTMVVAAPTSTGKTVVHELTILRAIIKQQETRGSTIKILYIAPTKALCQQKHQEWVSKYAVPPLNLNVMEITGDVDVRNSTGMRTVAQANIIITTPEKWDSLTRGWREHMFLLGAIDLLLIDEIHHLNDDRGATLEAVVVRMRMMTIVYASAKKAQQSQQQQQQQQQPASSALRIIALSATLPNLADIGEWIGCSADSVHFFDETFRPVPLTVHTLSFGSASNQFLFERSLDNKVSDIVVKYSAGKPTLVFCSSKKSTETVAQQLSVHISGRVLPTSGTTSDSNSSRNNNYGGRSGTAAAAAAAAVTLSLQNAANSVHNVDLKNVLRKGMAFHHGGLSADDRAVVEQCFLSGDIRVLCSTSTLAYGVNLPAHLVVIKGTNCWRGGARGYERLSRSDIIQMMGRAGRPGFDTTGVAVIMTSNEDRQHFGSLTLSADVVESTLPRILIETVCAEVTQTVISNIDDAMEWIKNTFFYVRVKRNPAFYGFVDMRSEAQMNSMLHDMCLNALTRLADADIISFSMETFTVQPLVEARIMTKYIIQFESMVVLMKLPAMCSMEMLLRTIADCTELHKPVRRTEKKLLNEAMKAAVRYPVKVRVQEPCHKAYVLLQSAVSSYEAINKDFSLKVEQSEIVEVCIRVLSALQALCVDKLRGMLLENTILLKRALLCRSWHTADKDVNTTNAVSSNNSSSSSSHNSIIGRSRGSSDSGSDFFVFTQCTGLLPSTLRSLKNAEINTVSRALDPRTQLSVSAVRAMCGNSVVETRRLGSFISLAYHTHLKVDSVALVHGSRSGCSRNNSSSTNTNNGSSTCSRPELIINLSPLHGELLAAHPLVVSGFVTTANSSSGSSSSSSRRSEGMDHRHYFLYDLEYHLVCYHALSGQLLCHRIVHGGSRKQQTFKVSTTGMHCDIDRCSNSSSNSSSITSADAGADVVLRVEDIRCCLLCPTMCGFDWVQQATGVVEAAAAAALTAVQQKKKMKTAVPVLKQQQLNFSSAGSSSSSPTTVTMAPIRSSGAPITVPMQNITDKDDVATSVSTFAATSPRYSAAAAATATSKWGDSSSSWNNRHDFDEFSYDDDDGDGDGEHESEGGDNELIRKEEDNVGYIGAKKQRTETKKAADVSGGGGGNFASSSRSSSSRSSSYRAHGLDALRKKGAELRLDLLPDVRRLRTTTPSITSTTTYNDNNTTCATNSSDTARAHDNTINSNSIAIIADSQVAAPVLISTSPYCSRSSFGGTHCLDGNTKSNSNSYSNSVNVAIANGSNSSGDSESDLLTNRSHFFSDLAGISERSSSRKSSGGNNAIDDVPPPQILESAGGASTQCNYNDVVDCWDLRPGGEVGNERPASDLLVVIEPSQSQACYMQRHQPNQSTRPPQYITPPLPPRTSGSGGSYTRSNERLKASSGCDTDNITSTGNDVLIPVVSETWSAREGDETPYRTSTWRNQQRQQPWFFPGMKGVHASTIAEEQGAASSMTSSTGIAFATFTPTANAAAGAANSSSSSSSAAVDIDEEDISFEDCFF